MQTKEIFYSKGKNDECYTPEYAVLPIIKYAEKFRDKIIWMPFDTEASNFYKLFKKAGFKVVISHIDNNQDFFTYEPEKWDVIISNPPFTNKKGIFERVLSFNKPFALIMTNTWLNDTAPKILFKDKDLQLLLFDKRIEFYNENGGIGSPTFGSSYYCWNFLDKQIIIETLDKPKKKK